jgi:tetratricopeptide (TPR) repeat protein
MDVYMACRNRLAGSPDLYLQCGDFLLRRHHNADAVRVLSNLADQPGDDIISLRYMARYLAQLEKWDQAVPLLEEVYARSPRDVVSVRELAMALVARGDQQQRAAPNSPSGKDWGKGSPDEHAYRAQRDYQSAIDLLYRFVQIPGPAGNFSSNFPASADTTVQHLILLTDLADVLARGNSTIDLAPGSGGVDKRLQRRIEMDLRIVLTCEAGADVALSVLEPSGETAMAGTASNAAGAVTDAGQGLQEYALRRVAGGMYKVQVQYPDIPQGRSAVSSRSNRRRVVQVDVTTDFGRPNEKHTRYTVLLPQRRGTQTVTDLFF